MKNCFCLRSPVCVFHGVVNIRAWLAECSNITMTHGVQFKISMCLSVIRGHFGSRAVDHVQSIVNLNF